MSDVDVDAQEWRWRWRWRLSLSLSVLTLLQPLCAQLHKQTKLVLPSAQTQANTCSHTHTLLLTLSHAHTLTHARWELVARILSFVYALELFIYVCKYTLFGSSAACVCLSVYLFSGQSALFCSPLPHLLSLNLWLALSFWLIKWLSNGEWVCWVACRLSAGQLSAALECCCYTRNISMSFTICLVYCRSSFCFSVLVFGFLVSFSVRFVFVFIFVLFSFFYIGFCLFSLGFINAFEWSLLASLLYFSRISVDFIWFLWHFIYAFLRAPFSFLNDLGLMSHGRVVSVCCGSLWSTEGFIAWIYMYKQGNMTMIL